MDVSCRDTAAGDVLPELVEGVELVLKIRLDPPPLSFPESRAVHNYISSKEPISFGAKILQAYRPFTMSPVLRLHLHSSPLTNAGHIPHDVVLKLYDRRCVSNMRKQCDEGKPWSLTKEREYRAYIASVEDRTAPVKDFSNPSYLADEEDISDGEFEAYLKHYAERMFMSEQAAYARLAPLQGKEVPRCYATVKWETSIPGFDGTEVVPGLLLEYISDVTLLDLIETWPARNLPLPRSNEVLIDLCQKSVAVVEHISDFDVLNEDVKLRNFLAREPILQDGGELIDCPVALIDLGHSRLRKENESEDTWVQAKWSQDEAGAVGFPLITQVGKSVGEGIWTYERSMRFYRPISDDESP